MDATSPSLLDRLRSAPAEADWQQLVDLYTPLIRNWLARHGVQAADTSDLEQEVLAIVVRKVPVFEHNGRTGAFRTWLRTITARCLKDFHRARRLRPAGPGGTDFQMLLAEMADPDSAASRLWDREHDLHVTRCLLARIRPDFSDQTWQAFARHVCEEIPAAEAARELGITVNAVFIAKSRILARLRQEAGNLLD